MEFSEIKIKFFSQGSIIVKILLNYELWIDYTCFLDYCNLIQTYCIKMENRIWGKNKTWFYPVCINWMVKVYWMLCNKSDWRWMKTFFFLFLVVWIKMHWTFVQNKTRNMTINRVRSDLLPSPSQWNAI